jgi:hypothetical protein
MRILAFILGLILVITFWFNNNWYYWSTGVILIWLAILTRGGGKNGK